MKKQLDIPYQARYTQERMGWDIFLDVKADDGANTLLWAENCTDKQPHGYQLSASETEEQAWEVFNEIQLEEADLSKMNISNYGFV